MINKALYKDYMKLFLEENSKINLISKNDEKYLWEKHIYDSLAFKYFYEKYNNNFKTLLDIGTGGGFPSIPIAIAYPDLEVTAVDSIGKKIKAVTNIGEKLELQNLKPLCIRVENLKGEYDIVTSRAVSSLKNIIEYSLPKLKKDGYFIAYKSRKAQEEIDEATSALKKYNAKIVDIIEYDLPLDEKVTRNLIIISK